MSNPRSIRSAPDAGLTEPDCCDSAALANAVDLDPGLRRWLTCPGLLTERLGALPDVRLRTVAETDVTLTAWERRVMQAKDRVGRRREILLHAGDTRYVYGTSLIPGRLLDVYPWLNTLGEMPLGAALTSRLAAERSEFRFRRLAGGLPLAQRAFGGVSERPLWARYSTFRLPGGLILVTEVFLPALAQWPLR